MLTGWNTQHRARAVQQTCVAVLKLPVAFACTAFGRRVLRVQIPGYPTHCPQLQAQSDKPHSVDPQTYQASTAGELTYGKDKAHDMLKLKRDGGNDKGGLAHPQDVTGNTANHTSWIVTND